jgi:P-type Cu+ transporter
VLLTEKPDGSYTEERIKSEFLQIGDLVQVPPGEMIPADGEIVYGKTTVDQAMITGGEYMPIPKTFSDRVIGGSEYQRFDPYSNYCCWK